METSKAEKENSREDLFVSLLDEILSPDNMAQAWKQVRANKGAAGVDGITVGEFPDHIRPHWETIKSKLREGTYKPSPVRRVLIPKEKGKFRTLGIPTVNTHGIRPSDSASHRASTRRTL